MKKFSKLINLMRALSLLVIGLFMSICSFSQLPTATEVASQMKVGWNLGNTLEAICGETAWGNPVTTQTLINSVKAAGFNTVRIPVAWDCHSTNNVIDATWMARVKTVVDYCMNANMYVILNIHWDNGWLENNVTTSAQTAVNAKQQAYWTQIANTFKGYDQRVLFASANEPNVSDATGMTVLLSYHQTFINAVRATGGNNSSRTLIIQGPSTDPEKTINLMNTMPTDQIANRLMAEVHYYQPWQFCGLATDESWGSMFYYWGNGNHSTIEPSRNATWGEESEVERLLGLLKSKFTDKGIPVVIGEFGTIKRSNPADMSKHIASREYYNKYVVSSALAKGMVPVYWDNGASDFGLFNRSTGAITDQGVVTAIMQGAGSCTPTTIVPYIQVNDGSWSQTSSTTVTSGAKVKFGPQPVSGGSWSWSGLASGTSREVTIYPTASGTATATYTNASGCNSTQVFTITVSGSITVAVTGVTMNPTSVSVAVGATTQLTATVAPTNATNKTVSWSTSNSSAATVSASGLVSGVAAGSATITVTTQDGNKTATCVVTVTGSSCTPTTIVPYIQVNGGSWQQTSSVTVNSGSTVKFGPQPVSGGSWSWTGCGTSGTSREQTITANSTCTATATYTNTSGCQSTQNFNVTVSSSNYPIVVRARGTNGSETINLTVGGTTVNTWTLTTSYADYSASTSLSGAINVVFTNDATGRDVQVDYVTINGTTNQAENQATNTGVWQNSQCGGSYSEWLHCNGYIGFSAFKSAEELIPIENVIKSEIYPNPAGDILTVNINASQGVIFIYNSMGEVMKTTKLEGQESVIDLSGLSSGLYFIKIEAENQVISKRFIKR